MSRLYRVGSIAALLNAVAGAAMLLVVFALIGIEAFADRQKLIDLAINRPWPLILQDILKFITVIVTLILIRIIHRILVSASPRTIKIATTFGIVGVITILVNASLSLYAIHQASNSSINAATGNQLNMAIAGLGLVVLLTTGVWYLLVNWSALKQQRFPRWVSYLGIASGALFLIPPLGIVAGLCSIVWSLAIFWFFRSQSDTKENAS